jgi:hypothetical protein
MRGQQSKWLEPALLDRVKRVEVGGWACGFGVQLEHPGGGPLGFIECPYGAPGDRLWVRETWCYAHPDYHDEAEGLRLGDRPVREGAPWWCHYAATDDVDEPKWKPSIHMPRWASRITLEVTAVRVERLHDITEFEAIAEGVESTAEFRWRDYMPEREAPAQTHSSARESFLSLWESINGTESLAANPWVWVVAFKRVTP